MTNERAGRKPRLFISSTVPEFRDLRSALKYWFEEIGFEVQVSEVSDFEHRPHDTAFEACFNNIRQSDFYVLLIGRDRGSWFDEATATSVTQQEYRVAYESFTTARNPEIVGFIRSGVLDSIDELRRANALGPSDLAFADRFIREVRRSDSPDTAAGFTIPFSSFKDVIDGIHSTLAATRAPLIRQAVEENLRQELEYNLLALVQKHEGRPLFHTWWLNSVRREIVLHKDDIGHERSLNFDQMKKITIYAQTAVPRAAHFVSQALTSAIVSGALLEWDADAKRYKPSALLEYLYDLQDQLAMFRLRSSGLDDAFHRRWFEHWEWSRVHENAAVNVATDDLLRIFGVHDSQANIERLVVSILLHLYRHGDLESVTLRHSSPIEEERAAIDNERPSRAELREWLSSNDVILRVALGDPDDAKRQEANELFAALEEILGADRARLLLYGKPPEPALTSDESIALQAILRERGYL